MRSEHQFNRFEDIFHLNGFKIHDRMKAPVEQYDGIIVSARSHKIGRAYKSLIMQYFGKSNFAFYDVTPQTVRFAVW